MIRVGYILPDNFSIMVVAAQSVFEMANILSKEKLYSVDLYSEKGGEVFSSVGVALNTQPLDFKSHADTWIIGGVVDPHGLTASADLISFLQRASRRARRVVSMCTGAFLLAKAGLLDGRRATTHWAYARALSDAHPDVIVEADRIFINDGPIWTSAGLTAGLDLALALVEKDLGAAVASKVAHALVMQQCRSGGQTQHSELLKLKSKSDRVNTVLDYIRLNLKDSLSIEQLAELVHISPRQFSRIFAAETGCTPSKAIANLRLEAARLMIEQGQHPLEIIARETGFRDRSHLRQAYFKTFRVSPQVARSQARSKSTQSKNVASTASVNNTESVSL